MLLDNNSDVVQVGDYIEHDMDMFEVVGLGFESSRILLKTTMGQHIITNIDDLRIVDITNEEYQRISEERNKRYKKECIKKKLRELPILNRYQGKILDTPHDFLMSCFNFSASPLSGDKHTAISTDDGIDVYAHVKLVMKMKELPVCFNNIVGNFSVAECGLESTKGMPSEVRGNFDVRGNNFDNIIDCPKIKGGFYCDDKLKTSKDYRKWAIHKELKKK